MALVTYPLGAGASAQALPVVNQLSDSIYGLVEKLKQTAMQDNAALQSVINDLDWLAEKAKHENNTTIDTYAKQLYLQGKTDDYIRLIAALSLYFVLRQSTPDCLDRRYCDFWTNILNRDKSYTIGHPENLLLLSWNYDSQVEKAYYEVVKNHFQSFRVKNRKHTWDTANPLLIKLNGSADFLNEEDFGNKLSMLYNWNTPKTTEEIVGRYEGAKKHSILSFAWLGEYSTQNNEASPTISAAQQHAKLTEVLVIIGYSLPYFNREIDRLIAGANNMKLLTKVYFQAPEKYVGSIKMRFQAIRDTKNIELISITDLDQFFIPPEL